VPCLGLHDNEKRSRRSRRQSEVVNELWRTQRPLRGNLYRGIRMRSGGKWRAAFQYLYKGYYGQVRLTPEEAARDRDDMVLQLWARDGGPRPYLNFPELVMVKLGKPQHGPEWFIQRDLKVYLRARQWNVEPNSRQPLSDRVSRSVCSPQEMGNPLDRLQATEALQLHEGSETQVARLGGVRHRYLDSDRCHARRVRQSLPAAQLAGLRKSRLDDSDPSRH